MRCLFMVVTLLLSAQASSACEALTDRNVFYKGPDDLILFDRDFPVTPYVARPGADLYIQRLIQAINKRGTQVVIVAPPPRGVLFAGKLDPDTIKGTTFEPFNNSGTADKLQKAYIESLKAFKGAVVVDVNKVYADFRETSPPDQLAYKHDSHWTPYLADATAKATAATIQIQIPSIYNSIERKGFKVIIERIGTRTSDGGWDGLIRRTCPDEPLYVEKQPIFKLIQPEGGDLLGEPDINVVLIGTSFSIPTFGLADYLSQALGTEVINASVNGGGPTSALSNYYLSKQPNSSEPKILIWEVPANMVALNEGNSLTVDNLRQVIPIVEPSGATTLSRRMPLTALTSVDVADANAQGQGQYIGLQFSNYKTRALPVTLTYADGQEAITLTRTHLDQTNHFYIELSPKLGVLKTVTLMPTEKLGGEVTVTLNHY